MAAQDRNWRVRFALGRAGADMHILAVTLRRDAY
jgi:hypothetical protein